MGAADGASESWRKSTYSQQTDCVEVSLTGGAARVRDSHDTTGGQLAFSASAWANFLRLVGDR
ncbi:MAG: DUF397 domain-containing protein [Saccharothrix sp.]|nr:DUF397 domain-containing protein [Saccharothrix sp.]